MNNNAPPHVNHNQDYIGLTYWQTRAEHRGENAKTTTTTKTPLKTSEWGKRTNLLNKYDYFDKSLKMIFPIARL